MIKRFHSNLFYAGDLEKTHEFYQKLGFESQRTDDGVRVTLGDFRLYFIDENKTPIQNESGKTPKGLGIYTYVEVDNVDKYFDFVKNNGIVPRTEPKTWPWGKREFVVKDPDGYKLVFYSSTKKEHYVCSGSCGGVADKPGTCQAEDCEKHGQPLEKCDCEDGRHQK